MGRHATIHNNMELWSDLDKNAHGAIRDDATLSIEGARRGRTRRLTEPLVFSTLRTWFLDDYIPSYGRALATTRIYRRCYWLDGLGITGAAKTIPVPELLQRIQSLSDTLAQESKPITLRGVVLEQGSSTRRDAHQQQHQQIGQTVQTVQTMASAENGKHVAKAAKTRRNSTKGEMALPKTSGVMQTSWLASSDKLLQGIEQSPAIFLLNPFGQAMFTADDLMALYKRTAPTELCLLLSHKQVETLLLTALRSPAYAIALNAVLRTDKWKALDVQDEGRRVEAVNAIIDLFVKAMQRHFVLPIQHIALPMNARPAVVELVPYTLLFATRRQDSLICMNDALCRYRRGVYDQSHRGVLAEEWFAAQQQTRRAEERVQLLDYIRQRGKAQRTRRWPDLRQHILLEHFGQFLLHEYDEAIQTLIADHAVTCEWRHKPVNPDEEPIPGNDDVLIWVS